MAVEIALLTTFATSVISVLGKKLANAAVSEINKYLNVEQNLLKLNNGIYKVQLNLENVDEENLAHSTFRSWVLDLTMLCYDIDDIIDNINLEIMRLDHQHRAAVACESGCLDSYRDTLWCNNDGPANDGRSRVKQIITSSVTKWKLPRIIADLMERLEDIQTNVDDVVKHTTAKTCRPPVIRDRSGSSYNTRLSKGRKIERQEIIKKLLLMQDGGVSIVGMAGLGKTVLADSILNDNKIRRGFDVIQRASAADWDSDDAIITKTIATKGWYSFQRRKSSSGSSSTCRSLLLLDDLRITGLRDWKGLRLALVRKLKHDPTHVLVTTRDPAVAKFTETSLHHLRPLSIEDTEEIIKSTVSFVLYHYHLSVLQSKVNCVAQKCGGLPLVADLIGDHLRAEYRSDPSLFMTAISSFEQEDLWQLKVFLHEILPELGFDEASLPKDLYKFLAYFALFPSEYYFNENELSLLWMAEGFATVATEWTLTPAIDHFDSLVSKSMLKVTRPSRGRASSSSSSPSSSSSTYQMHTFAHKFAQIIAWSIYFWLDEARLSSIKKGDIPSNFASSNIRHFSSCCQKLGEDILKLIGKNHGRLRTFLLLPEYEINIKKVPSSFFKQLEYLRVLGLRGSDITELPRTIGHLKHLRYLDVSYTSIMRLPVELCNLLGLQVLKLRPCLELYCLPENFVNLTNLIHLDLDMPRLRSTPTNLGRLTKLQTLPVFIVKKVKGHSVSELKNLNSLRDSVRISKLENVAKNSEAKDAMLKDKLKIRKLELEWTENSNQTPSTAEGVLTRLAPSDKLTELKVSNYKGITFPSWVNTLKDLSSIHLYHCPNCTTFPFLGLLPLLKRLKIEKMCKIKSVQRSPFRRGNQHGEYPTLEYLEICNMKRLVKWDKLVPEDMPHLRELRVIECPELLSMSMISHRSLIRPEIRDCPKLKVLQG